MGWETLRGVRSARTRRETTSNVTWSMRAVLAAALAGVVFATFLLLPSDGSGALGEDRRSPGVAKRDGKRGPFRFAALGDMGSGGKKQAALGQKMCRWRKHHPYKLVVTTGDNIYPRGEPENFGPHFYDPYACLLESGVRFRATLGNHDVDTDGGRPELNEPRFGMKGRNYVVRKKGVRFVIADSNAWRFGWLERATRTQAGDRWTIVVFHHPVYSPGTKHGSTHGLRPRLPQLFRKRGVDLVLNGHEHLYAVTKRLSGLRYVVTGGGGDRIYGCGERSFSATCREVHHFLYVTVGRHRMWVRAVSLDDGVIDSFRLRRLKPR